MADSTLTEVLRVSLELESESPLGEATPDTVDEFLERISADLIEGVPHKITDDRLKRLVGLYRAESLRWKQEEETKASKPKREPGAKAPARKSFAEAVDIDL